MRAPWPTNSSVTSSASRSSSRRISPRTGCCGPSAASMERSRPARSRWCFFSGYAIQSVRQSFLMPVDGQIWTEADVRRDGVSLDTILKEMNSRGASVKVAILDASRRNPFERRFRPVSAGLAPVSAPTGSLVMYSAAPSTVISDTDARPAPVRQGAAQGAAHDRPDRRRRVQPRADERDAGIAWPAGALAFVVADLGFLVFSLRSSGGVLFRLRSSRRVRRRRPCRARTSRS